MTLDEFYSKLSDLARYTHGKWYVGSRLHDYEFGKPLIRIMHSGLEFTWAPGKGIQPHYREVCPVEAVALWYGFAEGKYFGHPKRTYTYWDLAWAIGLTAPDVHRLFRAIDCECKEPHEAADLEVRDKLLAILGLRK
jgi:hypothetical protein